MLTTAWRKCYSSLNKTGPGCLLLRIGSVARRMGKVCRTMPGKYPLAIRSNLKKSLTRASYLARFIFLMTFSTWSVSSPWDQWVCLLALWCLQLHIPPGGFPLGPSMEALRKDACIMLGAGCFQTTWQGGVG
jgi:hypothetical protein